MKLKREVEDAKLQLAQKDSWVILFDYLCNDDNGEPVAFEFELKRRDFNRMIDPYIQRIIQSSRQFLEDRLLDSSDVSKLIYVGDPALVPFLRPPFAHPNQGLGLTLEDSIDPWTVLAQGAAVLAGSTSLEDESAEEWIKGRRFQVTVQGQEPGALQEKEPAPSFQSQAPVDLQVKEPAPGSQGQGPVESVEEELMPVPEGQAAGALPEEEPSPGSQAQEAEVLSMEEPVLVSEGQEAGVLPVEESAPTSQGVEPPNPPAPVETAVLAPELPGLIMCQSCGEQVEVVEIGELIYCVNCGVVLPDPQAQSKRDQEIAITSTQTRCFFCTLNVFPVHIGGKYYCPECGIELKI